MEFSDTHKILVIKLRHIGDVLLTVPVFRALRSRFPDARISALINSGTDEVLQGNPLVDEIIPFDRRVKEMGTVRKYGRELSFLRAIREKGFDMTVDLTGGDRPALLSFFSGARYRLGWKSGKGIMGKRYLYTHLSEPDSAKHMVLQNLEVVRGFGIDTGDLSIDFHIPEKSRGFAREIPGGRGSTTGAAVVHIHPTSKWLFKCWPDAYMADVIQWLVGRGVTVVVTSAPEKQEIEKARNILSLVGARRRLAPTPYLIDLCGRTSIKQLAAVSDNADLFFGVDSAPMHIAAAVGTPVVALFGPSGAFHWGPWDNNARPEGAYARRNGVRTFGRHTVLQSGRDCVPCGKDGCGGSKISDCLGDIRPDEVKAILGKKLGELKR